MPQLFPLAGLFRPTLGYKQDKTHPYVCATACRGARRRRGGGSSSERSRSRPRPRCPPRSRYPAPLLLRLPWLALRSASRAYLRAALTGRGRSCPRLAFLRSFSSLSFSLSPPFFPSFSRPCRQFDRIVSRVCESSPTARSFTLFLLVPSFSFFLLSCPRRLVSDARAENRLSSRSTHRASLLNQHVRSRAKSSRCFRWRLVAEVFKWAPNSDEKLFDPGMSARRWAQHFYRAFRETRATSRRSLARAREREFRTRAHTIFSLRRRATHWRDETKPRTRTTERVKQVGEQQVLLTSARGGRAATGRGRRGAGRRLF